MSEQIIKIDIEQFKNEYNNITDIPGNILEKVSEIKSTYTCFNSFYDPKMIWAKKIYNNKDKYNKPKAKNRFHIIIPEFSKTSEIKRSLIGYLNKLSHKNKENIYEKIREIINNNVMLDEIFNIILNYIKTSEDDIYCNILELFDKDYVALNIDKIWDNYLTNKEWNPPQYVYENNLLLLNDEYDLYCDYIKWKKNIHNMNKVWAKYKNDELIVLLNNIYNHVEEIINEDVHKYILDILLEQIYKLLSIKKYPDIIDKIKNIDIKNFDSSTKFFIYNIIEL
jgi:vacuolar-type H+-ATPase catalytic subunit A/Vma1